MAGVASGKPLGSQQAAVRQLESSPAWATCIAARSPSIDFVEADVNGRRTVAVEISPLPSNPPFQTAGLGSTKPADTTGSRNDNLGLATPQPNSSALRPNPAAECRRGERHILSVCQQTFLSNSPRQN